MGKNRRKKKERQGKMEEDIRGGQNKEGEKVQKREKRRVEKKMSENRDLVGIKPMPGHKL